MTAAIFSDALRKSFDGRDVLRDISFELPAGQCLVLLGPSGCGKSTLLNIVTGMLQADGGELWCDGQLLDSSARAVHRPMKKRCFAMVFQDFSLWPHMTVADNVAFGLKVQGIRGAERRKRVAEALEQVQMDELADRKPNTLSGGQAQRVAIARAIAVRPRLLLLDEPLSALDAKLRDELKVEISTLIRQTGVTALYVTHDQAEAFTLADRVALMNQGRIEQLDGPEALYQRPSTRFAAHFIGASNVIPFECHDNTVVLDGQQTIHWPVNGIARQGHLVVRREAVSITPHDGAPLNGHEVEVQLLGTCQRRHFLGERHEIVARLADGLDIRGYSRLPLAEGDAVRVSFPRQAVHVVHQ